MARDAAVRAVVGLVHHAVALTAVQYAVCLVGFGGIALPDDCTNGHFMSNECHEQCHARRVQRLTRSGRALQHIVDMQQPCHKTRLDQTTSRKVYRWMRRHCDHCSGTAGHLLRPWRMLTDGAAPPRPPPDFSRPLLCLLAVGWCYSVLSGGSRRHILLRQ